MRKRSVVAVAAIAAVLLSVPSIAHAGATKAESGLAADLRLLSHIPDAVRPSCLLFPASIEDTKPGGHYEAQLECHPDSETTIEYRQGADAYDAFDRLADDGDCAARSGYRIDGVEVGEWFCTTNTGTSNVRIMWTDNRFDVVGILDRTDVDVDAAEETWMNDAGPERATHDLPPLLSARTVRRSGAALLRRVPDAARYGCETVDLSRPENLVSSFGSANLWASAVVECDARGVPASVTYRRYRDADAYQFAYEPVSYLRYAEDDDPVCAGGYDGTWSVDDDDVGDVACYFLGVPGEGEAHILWTYDPDRIVSEAFALKQQSAQALYDWWKDSSGPST